MFFNKKNFETENKLRLKKLIEATITTQQIPGWEAKAFAIGGLTEVGFSKKHPEMLLVISSTGRGIINCNTLTKIARDKTNNNFSFINSYELWANGFNVLTNEQIAVAGLHGGGLPLGNTHGDQLLNTPINWPVNTIIFQPEYKSVYNQQQAPHCFTIGNYYELRAFGFSYNGNFFIIATSDQVVVFKKEVTTTTTI